MVAVAIEKARNPARDLHCAMCRVITGTAVWFFHFSRFSRGRGGEPWMSWAFCDGRAQVARASCGQSAHGARQVQGLVVLRWVGGAADAVSDMGWARGALGTWAAHDAILYEPLKFCILATMGKLALTQIEAKKPVPFRGVLVQRP